MTNLVKHQKVVSSLPGTLEASSVYYVRVGTGFDLYVTNSTGTVVDYKLNQSADLVRTQVRNETGSTLLRGTVVYISGVGGNKPLVLPAQANAEATSSGTLGVLQDDILTNHNGYAITSGELVGVDTSALSEGTVLWLSPTTAGLTTPTKPSAPNHTVYIGVVTRSHANQGSVLVRVVNGFELEELHNVAINTPTNGQVLTYESSTGLWKNTFSWDYLVTNWSAEPTLNATLSTGEVYNYVLNGTTRYRFVSNTYSAFDDAFYASFDGMSLTNLIVRRG